MKFYFPISSCIGLVLTGCAVPVSGPPPSTYVEMSVEYKQGQREAQTFTRAIGRKILAIKEIKYSRPVWGTASVSGEDSKVLKLTIFASGYPGQTASTTMSCKVLFEPGS